METSGRDVPPGPANAEALPAAQPPASETLAEVPRRRAGGAKRKASTLSSSAGTSFSAPPKRQAKERNLLHHVFPVHNGPCTRARQSPHKVAAAATHKPAGHVAVPAWATEAKAKDVSADGGQIKAEEEEVSEEPLVDVEFEAIRSRGASVHAVPTPAGWFSWNIIHPVEKHMLPSFFDGKSENRTSEVYMEIRNSIMKKFHSNPQKQVELKDFSELSVGDANARKEVLEFLDHWGLINFHPFPPSIPDASKSDADDTVKTSSLVDKLYQFETIQSFLQIKEEPLVPAAPPCLLPESALTDELVRPVGPSVEYHCNSCSADCSRKRYHCQKQADFDLCTDCYNEGKFGSGMLPADFILMESAEVPGLSGGSWTDQETLLLLEALELFGVNWNEIAEHVATKTKAQCILHFLQMPIEDSFLEGDDDDTDNNLDSKNQTSSNKESTATELMESDKKEAKKDGESSPADALEAETKKFESSENIDERITSKTDPLVNKSTDDEHIFQENGASFAIDALKAAFQAVGYFPEQGLGSFAEAGNPVMALAAFLSGVVEFDALISSCRSSLKAISEDSPGIQLATRHCFVLEDPPTDSKDPSLCVSPDIETSNAGIHKDESKMSILDTTGKSEEQNKIAASTENDGNSSSLLQDSSPKETDVEDVNDTTPKKAVPTTVQESVDQSLSGDQCMASNTKGLTGAALPVEPMPNIMKETEDLAFQGEVTKSKSEVIKTKAKKVSCPNSVDQKSNSMRSSDDVASTDRVQQHADSTKAVDKISTAVISEERECMQTGGSTDETKDKAVEGDRKESCNNDEKIFNPTAVDDDCTTDRLKRAAVTALSAAAVKAKLLAKLEEDEIRKLVSLIIEKQLHKLEVKLAFLTDIEGVVLRMREQTEKARHRLMLERSQIIAARFGAAPASLHSANPSSLPINRLAMGYGATGLKPLHMASRNPPPVRRP
ncbi:Zinc finger, ZZ type [Musa troglodytarum]|uniref:Zinc finger, ZZ type n=1 Tax=Musa troglodytarum TaxID=320322 RepID=A0A9E7ECE9_9LILI|nr:Zinc finger, ZZ type [Musa troglodytarum]URD74539.1 Zinc finger, ZZ type [Musa troglodytarum]URD74541.1 Zinc finger, ZZ type [Musa troglodytarum]URD74542.1 Zinc finger, ZZ type [Musa troglodytarum]